MSISDNVHLSLYYHNIRSVNNKSDDILLSTSTTIYDIIVLTETWLQPSQNASEFLSDNYKSYRKDRLDSDLIASHGGGVLIAINSKLNSEQIITPEMSSLECVCAKITLSDCCLFIFCSYIQPNASFETYCEHLTAIKSIDNLRPNDIIMVCGDFNLPNVQWLVNDDDDTSFMPIIGDSQSVKSNIARHITTELLDMGLLQISNIINANGNVLDLFYTNMPELAVIEKADFLLIPDNKSDKAHVQTMITIECQPTVCTPCDNDNTRYCFNKANFDSIREDLLSIDFNQVLSVVDVNEMVEVFYNILYEIFDKHVPRASIRISNKPIWFNKQLSQLKNLRNKEYKKWRRARLNDPNADPSSFQQAKDKFDDYQKERYTEYIKEIANIHKENPKKFWKYVNGRRKSSQTATKLTLGDKTATNDEDKAELFASFFSSVYAKYDDDNSILDYINQRNDHGNFKILSSVPVVERILATMDLNKGASHDLVPPLFLRKCSDILAFPLHMIFSKSLNEGIYPEKWKSGQIIPIFKAGKRSCVNNYRGVTIMPTLAKVFEKLVNQQLSIIISPLLSKTQHGFLSRRNIETNLMELTNHAINAFELKCQLDVSMQIFKKRLTW